MGRIQPGSDSMPGKERPASKDRVRVRHRYVPTRYFTQGKNIIHNVHQYFESEGSCLTAALVIKKTSDATGASERTVRRIKSEVLLSPDGIIHTPPLRSRLSTVVGQTDGFQKDCIRREILSFYERGELPSLTELLKRVKTSPISFSGSRTSLHRVVRQMGFRYKKAESGRRILMEREDIVSARNAYLRKLKSNRDSSDPRPEIFLDETWVNQNLCVERCWTDGDRVVGPKLKTGRGARFIILHAGGQNGFVPGGLLMFRSKNGAKGDYHESMDHQRFRLWFEEQLLPNIPERSLIIMDNASYHSKTVIKMPTTSSKKGDMIEWLSSANVAFDPSQTKKELYFICKQHKGKQEYEIDQLAMEKGHTILRLPPYHCMFNPIELIWAQLKSEVKKRNSNGDQSLKRVEEITHEAMNKITPETWRSCISHTKKIEEEYRAKDIAQDHLFEEFIINIMSDTSDENESEDDGH